jgi:SAM-dependent methyltransferase
MDTRDTQHTHTDAEAHLDRVGDALYAWRVKTVLPHLRGHALDIGCGTNVLMKRYGNGIGVDVFQFGGADLIVENTSALPFSDGEFDTICIIAALNHIPYREKVLTEAYRLLKPGGRIIITMIPNAMSRIWHFVRSPWDRDQHERGMEHDEVYGLSQHEVRTLLTQASFEVTQEIPFMLYLNTMTIAEKK